MNDPKAAVIDSLVGRPFWPLGVPEHTVCGETFDGRKIRASAVETVWNDMLLMDAIEGTGSYARLYSGSDSVTAACIEVAERMYGMTAAEGLQRWLEMPKKERKAVN